MVLNVNIKSKNTFSKPEFWVHNVSAATKWAKAATKLQNKKNYSDKKKIFVLRVIWSVFENAFFFVPNRNRILRFGYAKRTEERKKCMPTCHHHWNALGNLARVCCCCFCIFITFNSFYFSWCRRYTVLALERISYACKYNHFVTYFSFTSCLFSKKKVGEDAIGCLA